ncbi:MAG TPA: hypothetical protein QGH16_10250 [Verrucomicrobiota bacterium]|jgi:p-aminobenzoyl-glutamate transporter AbgT|nr:hypothetical protein [Verrucomicrobiota bacterium]
MQSGIDLLGWLGGIERVGNRLPNAPTLFFIATVLVMIATGAVF